MLSVCSVNARAASPTAEPSATSAAADSPVKVVSSKYAKEF